MKRFRVVIVALILVSLFLLPSYGFAETGTTNFSACYGGDGDNTDVTDFRNGFLNHSWSQYIYNLNLDPVSNNPSESRPQAISSIQKIWQQRGNTAPYLELVSNPTQKRQGGCFRSHGTTVTYH